MREVVPVKDSSVNICSLLYCQTIQVKLTVVDS